MKSNKEAEARFTLKLTCHPGIKYDTRSIQKMMNRFLTFSNLHGDFFGCAAQAKRGSNHTKVISVVEFNPAGILIYIQPNGNDSRRGVWLTVPKEFTGKAEQLFRKLRKGAEEYNN